MIFKKDKNKIYIEKNSRIIAEIEYKDIDNAYNIYHTYVDDSLRGQGIGKKLVDQVIKEAKKNNKKIVSSCTYAKKHLK